MSSDVVPIANMGRTRLLKLRFRPFIFNSRNPFGLAGEVHWHNAGSCISSLREKRV